VIGMWERLAHLRQSSFRMFLVFVPNSLGLLASVSLLGVSAFG